MSVGDDRALGGLLKRYRAAAGLTQEELAERAQVSARTVSDTERGLRTSIYRDTATRLAIALGLSDEDQARFVQAARRRPGPGIDERYALQPHPTRLIGRDDELGVLLASLADPNLRLITLTGPGGVGKTRLALEAASLPDTPLTAWVSLSATEDPDLVISTIAHAVGAVSLGSDPIGAIAGQIGQTPVLVVLDTFEHLLGASVQIAALLGACPRLKMMVTSREALRVRGEHEFAVGALTLPSAPTPDEVARAPATAMFLERMRAVTPDLSLDDETALLVTAICERLNGIPLAIELAAARGRHMPLATLHAELARNFDVLTGGARDLPERQQTMRDTVAWSYRLLDEDDRKRFRELSVFAGGWTLDAATAVCEPGTDALTASGILVDKSLVLLDRSASEPRYRMLDVIREYGRDERVHSRETSVAARHAAYFADLAKKAEPQLGLAGQDEWFRRLGEEQDNFRAALRHSIETDDPNLALRLCGDLWQFWRSNGDLAEGREWFRECLALAGGDETLRAKSLWGAAWLAYHQGDYEAADELGNELRILAEPAHDPVTKRNSLTINGMVALAYGRAQEAVAPFEEAVSIMRSLGQSWLLATSLLNLGSACVHAGEEARARPVLEEACALYERLGDQHFAARAALQLAYASIARGDLAHAQSLVSRSLMRFSELGDDWGAVEAIEAAAAVSAAAGEIERSARMTGAARSLRSTMTVRPLPFDKRFTERLLDAARARDEAAWGDGMRAGEALSRDEAIEEGLAGA